MNEKIKAKWLRALRSGKYKQWFHALTTLNKNGKPKGYCCLGVLCDLALKDGLKIRVEDSGRGYLIYNGESGILPNAVQKWARLKDPNPNVFNKEDCEDTLASLNDCGEKFKTIAICIEKSL